MLGPRSCDVSRTLFGQQVMSLLDISGAILAIVGQKDQSNSDLLGIIRNDKKCPIISCYSR